MIAVELEHSRPTESEQIHHIDNKGGRIVVRPVPEDLTLEPTLGEHPQKDHRMSSDIGVQYEVTDERARTLAASLSLEEQVRIAYFIDFAEPEPAVSDCETRS